MPNVQAGAHIGPYQVEAVIKQGGFAQVVSARRIANGTLHEAVAIKVARSEGRAGVDDDTYARALHSEVEALRALKHPGIVQLFPIQLDERRHPYKARAENITGQPWYFVMEYLAGGTVEELVRQNGALDTPLAVEIAHQVAMTLDYIHTSDYAHLDIKTNNIAFRRPLTPDLPPEAVLIDFGAAQKALRRAEVEAGALMYMPPERVQVLVGNRPPETVINKAAADIYALGITLYRMLTGELPFRGRREHVTTAIINDVPTRPMQINRDLVTRPELDALIMQMLEKDPQRRPSIKEILTRLDQAVAPPRLNTLRQETKHPPPRPGSGWKSAALALGALVIIQGAGLGYLWSSASERNGGALPVTTEAPAPTATLLPPTDSPLPTTVVAPTQPPVTIAPPTRTPTATRQPTNTPTRVVRPPTIVPTFTPPPTATPRPTATPVTPTPNTTPGSQP